MIIVAVGVWSPELSDPWRISGLTRATHQAPQPPGAAALTGVRVRGLWRDGEGWGGGRNLTAAGGWAAGGGTVHLLEGFLVAVEVRLGGERDKGLAPSIQRAQTSGTRPPPEEESCHLLPANQKAALIPSNAAEATSPRGTSKPSPSLEAAFPRQPPQQRYPLHTSLGLPPGLAAMVLTTSGERTVGLRGELGSGELFS